MSNPITYAGQTWPTARDWCLWIMQHNAAPGPAQNGQRAALDAFRAEVLAETHTVYRAEHDSIVMGLYTTAAEARKHCETELRREYTSSGISELKLSWREDEDTVHLPEDGEQELIESIGPHFNRPTGYVVTPLEVASEYDEEADE